VSLVAGCWLLVAGCWSLVAGRWLLVAGRWPGCRLLPRTIAPVTSSRQSHDGGGVSDLAIAARSIRIPATSDGYAAVRRRSARLSGSGWCADGQRACRAISASERGSVTRSLGLRHLRDPQRLLRLLRLFKAAAGHGIPTIHHLLHTHVHRGGVRPHLLRGGSNCLAATMAVVAGCALSMSSVRARP
jgi:hypothetical protein